MIRDHKMFILFHVLTLNAGAISVCKVSVYLYFFLGSLLQDVDPFIIILVNYKWIINGHEVA